MFRKIVTKYGNRTGSLCSYGFSHRSKLESAVCQMIYLLEKAGEIKHVRHEVRISLTEAKIVYIPDFECEDKDGQLFIEAKGFETPEWRLKRRLWQHYGPARLFVYGGSAKHCTLVEVLVPPGAAPNRR